VKIAFEANK